MIDAEEVVDGTAVQKVAYDYGREEQHVDRPEGRHEEKDASAMDDRPSKEEQHADRPEDRHEEKDASAIDDRPSKEEQNFITPAEDDRSFQEGLEMFDASADVENELDMIATEEGVEVDYEADMTVHKDE